MEYKIEKDSMGFVEVPKDVYWGAQTQRSLNNFQIGRDNMPLEVIKAIALIKGACAVVNFHNGDLSEEKKDAILQSTTEIIDDKLSSNFPLKVFQTGSGTQSNMNVNEVIANRANEILSKNILHPNDDVNKSQSSNDVFPSAMHIAAVMKISDELIPSMKNMIKIFENLEEKYDDVIKIGRTHLQDATPLKFSQELSGYREMISINLNMIEESMKGLLSLAIGGTAVGTGINAKPGFGDEVCEILREKTGFNFYSSKNKFHSLTSKDQLSYAHGALKALACNLFKMATDIKLLCSGPRCGLGEIKLPSNEPGSSIMPGKVNPTQAEAMTMACVQVMGNDTVISIAAANGNFELNVFMPVIINNFLHSVELLADSIKSFGNNCLIGMEPDKEVIEKHLQNSLMLVTALSPVIGYENAAKISKLAYEENISLKEAALRLQLVDSEEFDKIVDVKKMV
ncbi:MAG: class II fumarate hydratase [Peptoniphilus sp.]|nr:class II fumarate hydratase [Peptoniphilus sp.]